MSTMYRVVARLGTAARAAYAALTTGEFGWNVDNKVLLVGDDTNNPTQIATSKSTGKITYSTEFTPEFAHVDLLPNGTVAGIPLGKLNALPGLPIRGEGSEDWDNRELQGDQFIEIIVPESGTVGSIIIRATEELKSKLKSSNLRYFYGIDPPEDTRPGDMWFSSTDEIIYLRIGDTEDVESHIWLDFSSFSGGGGGMQFFENEAPPTTASVGDEWYDKGEDRLYKYLNNDDNLIWVERV